MSETPLDQVYSLFADIAGRRVKLEPFGIAFTKMTARQKGANPVWYVDRTPGHDWSIAKALNDLTTLASGSPSGFAAHPLARIAPFFESMGTWPTSRREFWWEREWRHIGDMTFVEQDVALVLCPEALIPRFEGLSQHRLYRAVDPTWSLERMIAHLVGLAPDKVTPFTPR